MQKQNKTQQMFQRDVDTYGCGLMQKQNKTQPTNGAQCSRYRLWFDVEIE